MSSKDGRVEIVYGRCFEESFEWGMVDTGIEKRNDGRPCAAITSSIDAARRQLISSIEVQVKFVANLSE